MAEALENSIYMTFVTFYGSQTFISMLTKVQPESGPYSYTVFLSATLYVDFFL
jgi:hypothetical protein